MTDDKTLVLATLDPGPFESAFGPALGLSYFVVRTAEEAFQLCEDLTPDFCVVDFKLDGSWNGYRASKQIASKRSSDQSEPKIYVMLKDYRSDGASDATWASHLQWAKNSGAAGLLPRDPAAVKQLMFGAQQFDRSSPDSTVNGHSRSHRSSKLSDFGPSVIEQRSMDKVDAVVRKLLVGPVAKRLTDGARDQVSKSLLAPDDYASYMGQKLPNDETRRKFFAALDSEIKSQFMQTVGGSTAVLEEINKKFCDLMGPFGPRFARSTMERLTAATGGDFRIETYIEALAKQIADDRRRQKFINSIQGIS